jgi:hypothetical protein
MKGIVLRVAAGAAVLAVLLMDIAVPASAAVTPPAKPIVSVSNPAPGDHLRRGQNWVTGVACDPNAALNDSTAGIARVQIFLGDRDLGGAAFFRPGGYFGAATLAGTNQEFSANAGEFSRLGIANPDVSTGCRHSFAAWRVLPSSFRHGTWTMNIYVLTKAGAETKVTIDPIVIDTGK